MNNLDQELAVLLEGDPGSVPAPIPDPAEMGIDPAVLNGSSPANKRPPHSEGESGISIVTAQEFAAVAEPGAAPLVGEPGEAVIPEGGDCMLYGDGGASKTTLSIDLAAHLAAGEDWLGIPVPAAVRVLVIEAEGPRPLFRRKLHRKLAGWEERISDRLLVLERPWADFRFPAAGEIADCVGEGKVDVLIVGPLTRVGMEELGTLQQVRDFMAEVQRFRIRSGRRLTVFLVHHDSKSGRVSGAWEGAGDTLLHAQVHAHGKTTLTFQKTRWSSSWHKRALELEWTAGEGFEVAASSERDLLPEITAWLSDHAHSTAKEIAKGVQAHETAVKGLLEGNPMFRFRTGEEARDVGRHATAQVWEVANDAT